MSEAFYLDDPEGNGVEVYSDRPAESWQWTGDDLRITMFAAADLAPFPSSSYFSFARAVSGQ